MTPNFLTATKFFYSNKMEFPAIFQSYLNSQFEMLTLGTECTHKAYIPAGH